MRREERKAALARRHCLPPPTTALSAEIQRKHSRTGSHGDQLSQAPLASTRLGGGPLRTTDSRAGACGTTSGAATTQAVRGRCPRAQPLPARRCRSHLPEPHSRCLNKVDHNRKKKKNATVKALLNRHSTHDQYALQFVAPPFSPSAGLNT